MPGLTIEPNLIKGMLASTGNRWMTERMMQNSIGKNTFRDIPNKRYFDTIVDCVREEHVAKLIKWVTSISEEHKRVSIIFITDTLFRG